MMYVRAILHTVSERDDTMTKVILLLVMLLLFVLAFPFSLLVTWILTKLGWMDE